jgi:hypothetical protein
MFKSGASPEAVITKHSYYKLNIGVASRYLNERVGGGTHRKNWSGVNKYGSV